MRVTRTPVSSISDIKIDGNIDMLGYTLSNLGSLVMVKNAGVQLLAALAADGDWSGLTVSATAGAGISKYDTVYFKNDGKVYTTRGDDAARMPAKGMALVDIVINEAGLFLVQGFIRRNTWDWTPGQLLYIRDIEAGQITATPPDTSGDQVQLVGIAVTADIAWFRPDTMMLEIT